MRTTLLAQGLGEYGALNGMADAVQRAALSAENALRNLDPPKVGAIAIALVVIVWLFRRR